MAARRKKRNTGSGGGLPGWAMLTIGLIIGLFVAFLVYLDDLDPLTSDEVAVEDTDELVDSESSDRPRFEFYSILPELEVVVPELSRPEEDPDLDPAPDAVTPAPEDAPAPAEIDEAGRFFLQVGSFQDPDPADQLRAEVALLGLDVEIREVEVNNDDWFRVRVGPFSDVERMEDAQDRLRSNGIDFLVLRDRG